jgi:hypothetical protein
MLTEQTKHTWVTPEVGEAVSNTTPPCPQKCDWKELWSFVFWVWEREMRKDKLISSRPHRCSRGKNLYMLAFGCDLGLHAMQINRAPLWATWLDQEPSSPKKPVKDFMSHNLWQRKEESPNHLHKEESKRKAVFRDLHSCLQTTEAKKKLCLAVLQAGQPQRDQAQEQSQESGTLPEVWKVRTRVDKTASSLKRATWESDKGQLGTSCHGQRGRASVSKAESDMWVPPRKYCWSLTLPFML